MKKACKQWTPPFLKSPKGRRDSFIDDSPSSSLPLNPAGQEQLKSATKSTHDPPFKQGPDLREKQSGGDNYHLPMQLNTLAPFLFFLSPALVPVGLAVDPGEAVLAVAMVAGPLVER